jgi:DNA-binding LacI/PurR family transcriptional regulator
MPPTLETIAKHAGVAKSTVSRVLTGQANVAQDTEFKVRQAVRTLGYFPSVRPGKGAKQTYRVALVYGHDVGTLVTRDSFFLELFAALESCSKANGHLLSVASVSADVKDVDSLKQFVSNHGIQGLLLLGQVEASCVDELRDAGIPTVSVEAPCRCRGVSSVVADLIGGISQAVAYLAGLGHRQIGLICSEHPFETVLDMRFGYLRGLMLQGLPFDERLVFTYGEREKFACASRLCDAIQEASPAATALICASDVLAMDFNHEIRRRGVAIPDELSIVGFGDTMKYQSGDTELTSIWVDVPYMAGKAFEMLATAIESRTSETQLVLAPTQLIVRSSTGPLASLAS